MRKPTAPSSLGHRQRLPSMSATTFEWMSFRNVLMALVVVQITVLIVIGFGAAPNESSLDHLLLRPAEEALDTFLSSLTSQQTSRQRYPTGGDTAPRTSLDETVELYKKLSEDWEHVGQFDTPGAFTQNLLKERNHPSFRQSQRTEDDLEKEIRGFIKEVSEQLPEQQITPCRYHKALTDGNDASSSLRILTRQACRKRSKDASHIVAYNSMPFDRTWCNKTIEAKSVQYFDAVCDEPAHLFSHEPSSRPGALKKMPPIRLRRLNSQAKQEQIECDVPCVATMDVCDHGKNEGDDMCLPDVRYWIVQDMNMTFVYSMLTTTENGNLVVDPKAYRNGELLATRSFQSEVPLSYFSWEAYGGTPTPAVNYDDVEKAVSFFHGKYLCGGGGIRAVDWANAAAQRIRLDSYGSCFHNVDLPVESMSLNNKVDRRRLLERYLFHLVIDTWTDPDFVDEVVWEALNAGVIPVYYGASNIKDHVPPNSIIAAADYGTKVATAERIEQVANDRALWETYHEWRKHPFPPKLKAKYDFLRTPPLCRMCRWSYAKKYGLGWNHQRQKLEEKDVNARLCFTKRGPLQHPFTETWMTPTLSRPATPGNCNWNLPHNATISSGDMSVNRTVYQHDGVIDIVVDEVSHTEGILILRLEFEQIQNDDGASFSNVHRQVLFDDSRVALTTSVAIQDEQSKVTILCDWPTTISTPSTGIIHIGVQTNGETELLPDERRTVRAIHENMDTLHDVRTEYSPSPYAKQMMEDFMNPLELFLVKKNS